MSKGDETRDRIIDRAWRLASRDGLEGITIGALAGELGLSKSGLFAHFGSKEDLQVEVLKAAAARWEQEVFRPALRTARGLPRLRALFENWLRWINDPGVPGGCIFFAASTELDDRPGRPRDYLVGAQRQLVASLARAVRLGVEEGHLRAGLDAEQVAFELHALMMGCHFWKRLLGDARAEARARAGFERLVTLAAAPAARKT